MMRVKISVLIVAMMSFCGMLFAQDEESRWVDSVYNSLTLEQRVGQLICMRANLPDKPFYEEVGKYIKKYNIGGVCFFRSDAVPQIEQTNEWQAMAQTPLMVSIDAEWGLAMRVNNTIDYPYQMTLGAITDNELLYAMGQQVADQCMRMGIHANFAPVADVNSNAKNPVIGMRSFGADPQNVGEKAAAYAAGESVTRADIDATANRLPEADVFELTDCIARRRFDDAARLLRDLLSNKNNHPIMLNALIGQQLRRMYACKAGQAAHRSRADIMELCGLRFDFIFDKLSAAAKPFSLNQLAELVKLSAEYDFRMKSTGQDPRALLLELFGRIAAEV